MENGETPFGRFDGPPGIWPLNGQQFPFRTRDEQQRRQQQEDVPADNTSAPHADGADGKQSSEKSKPPGEIGEAGAGADADANTNRAANGNEDAPPRYRRCGGYRSGGGCGRRWSGRCGNRGGSGGYDGTHCFRGFGGSSRCGPFSSGPGFGPADAIPFFLGPVAEFLRSHLGDLNNDGTPTGSRGEHDSKDQNKTSGAPEAPPKDLVPEADVFDTETAFIVHVSLPGAKKEDLGVNWDAEKSELSVAGVIYRPADEDMLKTLALDDRKVGPFERRVRLGTRASPAMIEADGITARLEEGILKVEIPKLDRDYVDIKKVDIE